MINLPNQTSKRVADTRDETLDSQHFSYRHDERYESILKSVCKDMLVIMVVFITNGLLITAN